VWALRSTVVLESPVWALRSTVDHFGLLKVHSEVPLWVGDIVYALGPVQLELGQAEVGDR